jgi:adenylate cyclase
MTARILVVDDEPDVEELVVQKFRHQIRDGALAFLFARDGVEALKLLEQDNGIDLIISDINMPRMDGLSLLAKLQAPISSLAPAFV